MTSVIQTSLASGEIAPSFHAAVDLAKYHSGLALCENAFVDFRGGVTNRPGTRFIGRALSDNQNVVLIPFQFKTTQSYSLEFSHKKMRVIMNGGFILSDPLEIVEIKKSRVTIRPGHGIETGDLVVLNVPQYPSVNGNTFLVDLATGSELRLNTLSGGPLFIPELEDKPYSKGGTISPYFYMVTPYDEKHLFELKYVQSADVLTITHRAYPQMDITREGHANWTIEEIKFGAKLLPPTGLREISNPGPTTTEGARNAMFAYVVTAVTEKGEESIASNRINIGPCRNIGTEAGSIKFGWDPVEGADGYSVYKANPAAVNPVGGGGGGDLPPVPDDSTIPLDEVIPVGVSFGFVGFTKSPVFTDTNILADFSQSPPQVFDPFADGAVLRVKITEGGSGYTQSSVAATIQSSTGQGALLDPVVSEGKVVAIIVRAQGEHYKETDLLVITGGTGAVGELELSEQTGNWPGVPAFFQQRKIYGSSDNAVETLWMSQPGLFKNFNVSRPLKDDDGITAGLFSKQVNDVKYMVEMPGGLVVLTGGGNAWQLSGGGTNEPISPIQILATPQAYNGCADVEPIVVNYDILYVQAKGTVIRDLSYNFFTNIYTGEDISVMSNHLVTGFNIKQWAWASDPHKVIWMIRKEDGALLAMTYMKEQKIIGWGRGWTKGLFQSVCTIQEGNESAVYFVVKRFLTGRWVQTIERMASKAMPYGIEDAWYVDCGLETELPTPDATVYMSGTEGTIVISLNKSILSTADIGKVFRASGGVGIVTTLYSGNQASVTLWKNIDQIVPWNEAADPNGKPIALPAGPGKWSLAAPITEVSGLEHLEREWVSILADGSVHPQQQVMGGKIRFEQPVTKAIIGLPYASRVQTLRLDTGEPTIQGLRKKIAAVTLRVVNTRGLWVGSTFETSYPIKEHVGRPYTTPIQPVTGDQRIVMDPSWNTEGQVCVQQPDPLPFTVLGFIPEVVPGDTYGRQSR